MPTPVPVNNFETIPVIDKDPYEYGTPLAATAAPSRCRREAEMVCDGEIDRTGG